MTNRILIFFISFYCITANADDGSGLWLNYRKVNNDVKALLANDFKVIVADTSKATIRIAALEFQQALMQFANLSVPIVKSSNSSSLVIKTQLKKGISDDGFTIQSIGNQIVISSPTDVGVLYGVFHLLRLIQTGEYSSSLNISESPDYKLRMLNHWDNLDGTVERGYAGRSLWQWDDMPSVISPRYAEYARANASIGINAIVPNNVNASPQILTAEYITKLKALADIFRPYGIKIFVSVNFSSPSFIGGLENSDPLNPQVQKWWSDKAKEIYRSIPDFGGFLVKANSEGLPGPHDYGRTHADGANMLARALKPHGGLVIWRSFVYEPTGSDRVKQALDEFMPLDGKFADNVIIQVKNGPLDFQPREPFSPLFGRMKKTPMMVEFQITQEYLGFSNHLVYLAPLFTEALQSDTYSVGEGSTVARVTDGTLYKSKQSAIAGVANIGLDKNWCGHTFAQSNWYAFGRLAWRHSYNPADIATEWIKMTFSDDEQFVAPIADVMMRSREAAVNYMMPLGLHHIFAWDHHYGPEPWCEIEGARPDWLPSYYHNASSEGVGYNRTSTGSNAVNQYNEPLKSKFDDISQCPENMLLWFHFVPWNHTMINGRTLWDEMCYRYQQGVDEVRHFQNVWDRMEQFVDKEQFQLVQRRLRIQSRDAVWWRDACLLYFQTFSNKPIPYQLERPVHNLDELMKIKLDLKHHN